MKFLRLFEDIDAVRKNYPKIKKDDFDRLIALDPTYNPNRDSVGTYGKWILNLFNKGKLDRENHVTDILNRFEDSKKQLKNKDINTFKSIEDLDDYLNDDSNYNELSNRQKLRKTQTEVRQTELGKEAELIFSNENWEVWIPHTYTASCKLGQGTNWCTASTANDYYYKQYTSKGNLYINIHSDGHKWQFHSQSNSYMNEKDVAIDLAKFFDENLDLCEFYANYGKVTGNIYKNANAVKRKNEAIEKYSGDLDVFDYNKETKDDFKYVKNLVHKVIIDKTVKIIPNEAFYMCAHLTEIKIGPNVKKIGDMAFTSCTNVTYLDLPDTLEHIGENAFRNTGIEEITVPPSIVSMAEGAFSACHNLKKITFNNVHFGIIPSTTCMGCNMLKEVIIPEGFTAIGNSAFNNCTSLEEIKFPSTIKRIVTAAFRGSGIKELDAENLHQIYDNAFENCINLTRVNTPNITRIGQRAFSKCDSLDEINIPESIIEIKKAAFADGAIKVINCAVDKPTEYWDKQWNQGCKAKINWNVT